MDRHLDRVIEQVLCGDRSADDPELLELLGRDPRARARWKRLTALASTLDEMGSTERGIRSQAGPTSDPGAERIAEVVRVHLKRRTPGSRRPGWLWGALLAAGLVLTLWTLRSPTPVPPFRELDLELDSVVLSAGDPAISGMTAVELGGGSWRLEWVDAEEAFGRTYFVRIHERRGAAVGAALEALGSEELLIPSWTLSVPADREPDGLGWSVEVRDASGNLAAQSAVRALARP